MEIYGEPWPEGKTSSFFCEVRRGSGSKPAVQALSLGARIVLLVETPKERRKWGEGGIFLPSSSLFPSFNLSLTLRVAISTLPIVVLS